MFKLLTTLLLGASLTFSALSEDLSKPKHIVLKKGNHVVIDSEINFGSTAKAAVELNLLNLTRANKNSPIYLFLNTPGGDIDAGINFINAVKHIKNLKVIVLFAASMGAMITESLPGERLITDDGLLMFHRARLGLSGQIAEGEFESRFKDYSTNSGRYNWDQDL